MTHAPNYSRLRLVSALLPVSLVIALAACGGSQDRVQTDTAAPIDSAQAQRCASITVFETSLLGVNVTLAKKTSTPADKNKVFDTVKKAGADLSGAIPEFAPNVQKVVEDQRKRLGLATGPGAASTLAVTDDAYQTINTYNATNCPQPGAPAGGANPSTTKAAKPSPTTAKPGPTAKAPGFPTTTAATPTTKPATG
jgi:hypothetical protein